MRLMVLLPKLWGPGLLVCAAGADERCRLEATSKLLCLCVQVMELLGQSLWDVCNVPLRNCLSESYVACVAVEALDILRGMHEKGWGTLLCHCPALV